MSESIVLQKSFTFASRIVRLCDYLCKKKKEFRMSDQLFRCGTSVGANLREAKYAQSKRDFISKNSIALKEIAETQYWLGLLYETDYLSAAEYESIIADCEELLKLLTAIVRSSKEECN